MQKLNEIKTKNDFFFEYLTENSQNELKKAEEFINNNISSQVPKEKLDINLELLKAYTVVPGKNCSKCLKALNNEAQFYCYFCQVYYCNSCGNSVDQSKKGMEQLVDIHNLIFMPKLDDYSNLVVDVHRLGNNKASLNKNINYREHYATCNCCKNIISSESRFICLICRSGIKCSSYCDMCQSCIDIINNPGHQKYSEYKQKCMQEDKHDFTSHIYLRLWFSTDEFGIYY